MNTESDPERPSAAPEGAQGEESHHPGLAPEDLRAVAEEITREFPLVAAQPTLVLFDLDPEHLQAQWQVSDTSLATAWRAFPSGSGVRPTLRLRRTGEEGVRELALPQGLPAAGLQGEARFAVEGGGGELEAELGLANSDGGWLLLVRSNRVRLPEQPRQRTAAAAMEESRRAPAPPAPAPPPAWGPVGGGPPPSLSAAPGTAPPGAVDVAARPALSPAAATPAEGPTPPIGPVEPALAAAGTPLTPEFPLAVPMATPAAPAGRVVLTASEVLAAAAARDRALALPGAAEPPAPRPRAEQRGVPVTAGAPAPIPPAAAPETAPGAWPELPPPILPTGEAAGMPPFDPRGALSSGVFLSSGPADLEIHAELHVWGRAAPGARIDVFGRQVRVGADGRFSLRRSLDDPGLLARALVAEGTEPGSALE